LISAGGEMAQSSSTPETEARAQVAASLVTWEVRGRQVNQFNIP